MHIIRNLYLSLSTFILFPVTGWAINTNNKASIELGKVYLADQKYRSVKEFTKYELTEMKFWDKINLIKVRAIINKFSWPHDSFINEEGSRTIFLTIQHSELRIHKYYLTLIKQAAELNKLKKSTVGYLEDRIAIQEGNLQIYGTQIGKSNEEQNYFVLPLYQPELVDERRRSIGLQPMSEYLKLWNIEWTVNAVNDQ